jgi:hypothetical protein
MYFYVLLYYCHRANTQLQLNKYIYIKDVSLEGIAFAHVSCPFTDSDETQYTMLS